MSNDNVDQVSNEIKENEQEKENDLSEQQNEQQKTNIDVESDGNEKQDLKDDKIDNDESQTKNNKNDEEWKVNCSDEETFYGDENNYRIVNGKRIWEPKIEEIVSLYQQLEHKGFIELKWQCPGRRSPSVHSAQQSNEKKPEINDEVHKTNESNEFDFDDDFGKEPSLPTKVTQPRKRLNQGEALIILNNLFFESIIISIVN